MPDLRSKPVDRLVVDNGVRVDVVVIDNDVLVLRLTVYLLGQLHHDLRNVVTVVGHPLVREARLRQFHLRLLPTDQGHHLGGGYFLRHRGQRDGAADLPFPLAGLAVGAAFKLELGARRRAIPAVGQLRNLGIHCVGVVPCRVTLRHNVARFVAVDAVPEHPDHGVPQWLRYLVRVVKLPRQLRAPLEHLVHRDRRERVGQCVVRSYRCVDVDLCVGARRRGLQVLGAGEEGQLLQHVLGGSDAPGYLHLDVGYCPPGLAVLCVRHAQDTGAVGGAGRVGLQPCFDGDLLEQVGVVVPLVAVQPVGQRPVHVQADTAGYHVR